MSFVILEKNQPWTNRVVGKTEDLHSSDRHYRGGNREELVPVNRFQRTLAWMALALVTSPISPSPAADERSAPPTQWTETAARQAQKAQRRQREARIRWEYEQRRSAAHVQMPNTLYASTPSLRAYADLSCPVLLEEDTHHIYSGTLDGRGDGPAVLGTSGSVRTSASRQSGINGFPARRQPDIAYSRWSSAPTPKYNADSRPIKEWGWIAATAQPKLAAETTRHVHLVPSASEASRQGFVRVINHSAEGGDVRIVPVDDGGQAFEAITLSIDANETVHFNSDDLEQGNDRKGLSGGTGAGEGDWRLELSSDLEIEVLSYVRTEDGFLTAMHDVAPSTATRHRIAMFNPGSNRNQESLLRLINPGEEAAQIIVYGIDDKGTSGGDGVSLTLTARESRTVTAWELESGTDGLTGKLGDGSGKWQLMITADQPVVVMSLLHSPTGHLTNLSTAPDRGARSGARLERIALTTQEVFQELISGPVVQSKCINCHVEGGASGDTRLVFVPETDNGHEAANLEVFRDFLDEVDDGASYLLNKVQGALGHGGGIQVARGTEDYANLERLLVLLGGQVDSVLVTPQNLFDGVTMEPARSTLRRAAIIFAGRHPTAGEYASVGAGDLERLRAAVRGLMGGPAFREFLVSGANDRLLTDRDWLVVDPNDGHLTAHANRYFELRTVDEPFAWQTWAFGAQYGFRRAPLELIAHVVTNDLPYTEILTADYVMANPMSAEGYGAQTAFDDPDDAHEFRPSEVVDYYLQGDGYDVQCEQGNCVHSAPESLRVDYPHAGVLNTKVFLQRYPTTPTNRNRARSRWTYYHFLGLDIEQSASRTTDPVALADTDNPTRFNPACTVCHSVLDPVAGAFQDYGDVGFYKDQYGGTDSLDEFYKYSPPGGTRVSVGARSPGDGSSRLGPVRLVAGRGNEIGVRAVGAADRTGYRIALGNVVVRNPDGREVSRRAAREAVQPGSCGEPVEGGYALGDCRELLVLPLEVPADGDYLVDVEAWRLDDEEADAAFDAWLPGPFYRRGDTWYRDMLEPGLAGAGAPRDTDSLQWLARSMVADERFAEAAVKFWWPAVMGSDMVEPPAAGDPAFAARLSASNGHAEELRRLANGFRNGFRGRRAYDLKDLLTEIVVSQWFRTASVPDSDPVRVGALATAGAKRLLTPEELSHKTQALAGFEWGRRVPQPGQAPVNDNRGALSRPDEYALLYGGIDSNGVIERAREITSVMAGVAQSHAVESSCPIVMREFYLIDADRRRLFGGIDLDTPPDTGAGSRQVRDKLVELYATLFAVETSPSSGEIRDAHAFFMDVHRRKTGGSFRESGTSCDWATDQRFLDGIVDGAFGPIGDEGTHGWDWDRIDRHFDSIDWSDPHGVAQTWTVVLAYLLMDFRYLYL